MGTNIARPRCDHCGGENVKLRRQIKADGTAAYAWRCLDCDRWAQKPPYWLPYRELEMRLTRQGATLDDIPIAEDYSEQCPCIICGAPGQWHHFAPQAMSEQFGPDWYKWPCDYLCVYHHQLWHKLVTPALVGWHD